MPRSKEFEAFACELFEGLGPVRARGMFGGAGLYVDDVMFALIADEQIYLKVDDANRSAFEELGLAPFTYEAKGGKRAVMSYHALPETCLDDAEEAREWGEGALAAARRAKAKAKPKRKRKPAR
ncbi:MAG: TfoX/Sxy family protein [Pseudomonadota bacterium]